MTVNCLLGFLYPSSEWFLSLIQIHDFNLELMVFLLSFLGLSMFFLISNSFLFVQSCSSTTLEFWWTLIPLSITGILLIPTLIALYTLSIPNMFPVMTFKAIGHQWYWEYDVQLSLLNINFDSYMNILEGGSRLLDTTLGLIFPTNNIIRVLVTSSDVIHSFFIPGLGLKLDAVPGRLSEFMFKSELSGVMYGMCAEICGKGHSTMPIKLVFISENSFKSLMLH